MIGRRSFFKKFSAIVAIVALAPEIAFRYRPELPAAPPLDLHELIERVYAIARARQHGDAELIDIYTDAEGARIWQEQFPKAMIRYVKLHDRQEGIWAQLEKCRGLSDAENQTTPETYA